jgi:hypothetical protein
MTYAPVAALPMTVTRRDKRAVAPQKLGLLLAFGGFLIGFVCPTFAQQEDTVDPGIAQQRNLLGDATALGEVGALAIQLQTELLALIRSLGLDAKQVLHSRHG